MPDPWRCPQDWPPIWNAPSSPYGSETQMQPFHNPTHPPAHNPIVGERVAALEVGHTHLRETIRAHNDRLAQGDSRMNHHAQTIHSLHQETAALAAQMVQMSTVPDWIAAEQARRTEVIAGKENRRAARREALALFQYAVAILLIIAAALGKVPWDVVKQAHSVLGHGP